MLVRVCESKPRCERLIEPSSWFPPKPPQGGRSGLTSVRPCGSLASSASLGWPRRPDFGQALWLPGLQSIFLLGWPRRPDFGQALCAVASSAWPDFGQALWPPASLSAWLGWPRRPDFGQAPWLPASLSAWLGWPRRPDFGQAPWLLASL